MKRLIQLFSLKSFLKSINYRKLISISKQYEPFIPKYLRMEMLGISDNLLELNYDDILLQNCFMDILYGYIIPCLKISNDDFNNFELGCTSLGVISKETPLIAQNFDYSLFFKPTAAFVHVITPRLTEIFSLRLGSLLSLPIGVNNWGLSLRVNVVKTRQRGKISIPSSILSRIALECCQDAESFFHLQKKFGGTGSYNLLIADREKIIALEGLTNKIYRTDTKNYIVKTNTFTNPKFQNLLFDNEYSKLRQAYGEFRLDSLYENKSGVIQDTDLLQIMKDNSIICRENIFNSMTLAFLTDKYFGLGNPKEKTYGVIPLKRGEN